MADLRDSSSSSDKGPKKDLIKAPFLRSIKQYVREISPNLKLEDAAKESVFLLLSTYCGVISLSASNFMRNQGRKRVKKEDMQKLCMSVTTNTLLRIKILKMDKDRSHFRSAYIKQILSSKSELRLDSDSIEYFSYVLDLILDVVFEKFQDKEYKVKTTIKAEEISSKVEKLIASFGEVTIPNSDVQIAIAIDSMMK